KARSRLERMSLDWENLQQRIQKRQDGTVINAVQLTGLPQNANIKQVGARLNELADKARTGGDYEELGSLYGFQLLVKTAISEKEELDFRINLFFVQGEINIKYTCYNSIMAKDPEMDSLNTLWA